MEINLVGTKEKCKLLQRQRWLCPTDPPHGALLSKSAVNKFRCFIRNKSRLFRALPASHWNVLHVIVFVVYVQPKQLFFFYWICMLCHSIKGGCLIQDLAFSVSKLESPRNKTWPFFLQINCFPWLSHLPSTSFQNICKHQTSWHQKVCNLNTSSIDAPDFSAARGGPSGHLNKPNLFCDFRLHVAHQALTTLTYSTKTFGVGPSPDVLSSP